jgi:alkaline phosphatase D
VGDVVVLTGDVHSTWVADLAADFDDPRSARLGTELVAPGVSSEGADIAVVEDAIRAGNEHVKHSEAHHRGWLRHELTADRWTAEIRHVDDASRPGTPVTTTSTWVIHPGEPVQEA